MADTYNALPTNWQLGDAAVFTNAAAVTLSFPAGRYTVRCLGAGGRRGSDAYDSSTHITYLGGDGGSGALAQGELRLGRRSALTLRPGPANTVRYHENSTGGVPKLTGASYVARGDGVLIAAGCGGRGQDGVGPLLYYHGAAGHSAHGAVRTASVSLADYNQFDNVNTGLGPVNTYAGGGVGETQGRSPASGEIRFTLVELFDPLPLYARTEAGWRPVAEALVRQGGAWVSAWPLYKGESGWK